MSPGMYICLIGWVQCFFGVLNIVIACVCDVGGHDVCLVNLHGCWIHVTTGNWIVVVFHDILTIRNALHWTLILLIPFCLGWGHWQCNCWWWLLLDPLGSGPIIQGWFGGGWRVCSHSKVILFLLHMQMTWHVWLRQTELRWRYCGNLVGISWWGIFIQRLVFWHRVHRGRMYQCQVQVSFHWHGIGWQR